MSRSQHKRAFVATLAPAALAARFEMDQAQWTVYYRVLKAVPLELLEAAVDKALARDSPWMPKPGEWLGLVDQVKAERRASHPHQPCSACVSGWRYLEVDGVTKVERCSCWLAWRDHVRALMGEAPRQVTSGGGQDADD